MSSIELPTPPVSRIISIGCPFCAAEPGDRCHTKSGKERGPHRQRWVELASRQRHHPAVAVVCADQPQLGLRAGEQYLALPYWLDPGKVTLLARLPDGHDPQCNQYTNEVRWLRWATPAERHQLTDWQKAAR